MNIEHWNTAIDGPLTESKLRTRLEKLGYYVARYEYPPGTHFPDHSHSVDKIDAVLAGRFQMTMSGRSVVLEAGDCLKVPRGLVHSATVIGDVCVVSLDATREP